MNDYLIKIGNQKYIADNRQPLINFLPDKEVMKGCLKGVCRVCKCKLILGSILENGKEVSIQSDFLPCISRVNANSEIKPSINHFLTARVEKISLLSKNILEVCLEVKNIFYNAKSIISLKHPETGSLRNYSIVTLNKSSYNHLIFHVKLNPEGLFSKLFTELKPNAYIEFTICNPTLPRYEILPKSLNVVSGGSGMGSALSRAQEIIKKYNISDVLIYAINRTEISDYHLFCIESLKLSVQCNVKVINIPFKKWTSPNFHIESCLDTSFLTIGVGSDNVINRLQSLPLCELESFG